MGAHDVVRAGGDLRAARVGAGLSLREVGRRTMLSASEISRIERGVVPGVPAIVLARIGGAVGLDVRVRAYPGPDPIRDAAQQRVLGRLRPFLHPALRLQLEVPIGPPGDLRAWDGVLDGFRAMDGEPDTRDVKVECETRIDDGQAFLRRLALKIRDGDAGAVLVVLADTRTNRAALAATDLMAGDHFSVSPRQAFGALRAGLHPGGSTIVFV
jgi:transcriptional regulator with XRE-family HTH domain